MSGASSKQQANIFLYKNMLWCKASYVRGARKFVFCFFIFKNVKRNRKALLLTSIYHYYYFSIFITIIIAVPVIIVIIWPSSFYQYSRLLLSSPPSSSLLSLSLLSLLFSQVAFHKIFFLSFLRAVIAFDALYHKLFLKSYAVSL